MARGAAVRAVALWAARAGAILMSPSTRTPAPVALRPSKAAPLFPPSQKKPRTGSLDSAGPLYLSLSALVGQLKACLSREGGAPYSDGMIEEVRTLLARTELNPREWEGFKQFESDRYTRNIVAVDERFVALLLCWDKGQVSSIHDHAGSSCWVKLLSGSLEEQRYGTRFEGGEWPKVGAATEVAAGEATYMDNSLGVHSIANPSASEVAVSLHVYAPAFETCGIFSADGTISRGSMVAALAPEGPRRKDLFREPPKYSTGSLSLGSLGATLEQLAVLEDDAATDAVVTSLLDRLELTPEEWREFASGPCFSEFAYTRHLAHVSDKFSVVVCCWTPGQRSEPHSHGDDRRSWTKVLHGRVALDFEAQSLTCEVDAHAVGGEGSFREDAWMRASPRVVREASGESVAVSLHVLSPPMTAQAYATGHVRDVVVHACSPSDGLAAAAWRGNNVYTNIPGLVALLEQEFAKGRSKDLPRSKQIERLTSLLDNAKLNRDEWQSYAAWNADTFSRVLLAETDAFNLVLVAWEKGNYSPVHDHGGSAQWTKILQGSLDEATYALDAIDGSMHLARTGPMVEDTVTYASPDTIHGCACDDRCFSLTLYAPPYKAAHAYSENGNEVTRVEIPTHVLGDKVDADAPQLTRPEVSMKPPDADAAPKGRDPRATWGVGASLDACEPPPPPDDSW